MIEMNNNGGVFMDSSDVARYGNAAEALAQSILLDIKKGNMISSATVLALGEFEVAKKVMQTVFDFANKQSDTKLNS